MPWSHRLSSIALIAFAVMLLWMFSVSPSSTVQAQEAATPLPTSLNESAPAGCAPKGVR